MNVKIDRPLNVGNFKQTLCKVVSPLPECFMGMDITSSWRILLLPSIVKPQSVDGILIEAIVWNAEVDGVKVKLCAIIGMFEPSLCEVIAST